MLNGLELGITLAEIHFGQEVYQFGHKFRIIVTDTEIFGQGACSVTDDFQAG